MLLAFANQAMEKLCTDPDKYGKKEHLPQKIIKELKILLLILQEMNNCKDFFKPVHIQYGFEKCKNQKGLMSIRLDRKYRVTFYDIDHDEKKEFIDIIGIEIKGVSNHYGN